MGNRRGMSRGMFFATILAASGFVHADAQDDAIRARCPAAQEWLDHKKAGGSALSPEAMAAEDKAGKFGDPALRKAIHERYVTDQADRYAMINANGAQDAGKKAFLGDRDRLAWLKPQLTTKGFPTVAQVGHAGVEEAFIMVQHADQDPAFQQAMLPELIRAANAGDVSKGDVAMLTDRTLRAENKPQRYGTQYMSKPGDIHDLTPQPTEDPAHVDERRASMGMMPQKDYECVLGVVYTPAGAAP